MYLSSSSQRLDVNFKSTSDICGQLMVWCGLFWTDSHESVVPALPIGDFHSLFRVCGYWHTAPSIPLLRSIRHCGLFVYVCLCGFHATEIFCCLSGRWQTQTHASNHNCTHTHPEVKITCPQKHLTRQLCVNRSLRMWPRNSDTPKLTARLSFQSIVNGALLYPTKISERRDLRPLWSFSDHVQHFHLLSSYNLWHDLIFHPPLTWLKIKINTYWLILIFYCIWTPPSLITTIKCTNQHLCIHTTSCIQVSVNLHGPFYPISMTVSHMAGPSAWASNTSANRGKKVLSVPGPQGTALVPAEPAPPCSRWRHYSIKCNKHPNPAGDIHYHWQQACVSARRPQRQWVRAARWHCAGIRVNDRV